MKRLLIVVVHVLVLTLVAVAIARAQTAPEATRFTIGGAPILAQPRGEFGINLDRSFGGTGGLTYHLDRPGFIGLKFDFAAVPYGHEKRKVALSPLISERILLDLTTTNWMSAVSFGPELALPKGPVRPYFNTGFSELFFKTSSALSGGSDEAFVGTTNHSDATASWFLGGGLRIPLAGNDPVKAISLDLGFRYQYGGSASYLREGSIEDHPNGSITLNPLVSRTPHVIYMIGVRYRIPHNPFLPCRRFLC